MTAGGRSVLNSILNEWALDISDSFFSTPPREIHEKHTLNTPAGRLGLFGLPLRHHGTHKLNSNRADRSIGSIIQGVSRYVPKRADIQLDISSLQSPILSLFVCDALPSLRIIAEAVLVSPGPLNRQFYLV